MSATTGDHPVVLFSDDDPGLMRVLLRQAKQAGLWAISDLNSDVETLVKQVRPAVIVLDVDQRISGLELLKRLKKDPLTRELTVIVCTGLDKPGLKEECLQLGAAEFVQKPMDAAFVLHVAFTANRISAEAERLRRS
jgi:CheY-like chemotaxis protein